MRRRTLAALAPLALALSVLAAACGGGGGGGGTTTAPPTGATGGAQTGAAAATGGAQTTGGSSSVSGSISVMGIWVGDEQKAFKQVIDGFTQAYPNVSVKYNPAGDNLPTVLGTAVKGGNPPDIAVPAQPGLVSDLASQGALKPIDFLKSTIAQNFGQSAVDLGTVDGTLYGLLYKVNNKSTVWYNVPVFNDAGVKAPTTWDELLSDAKTIKASGVPAYSIGGADGWTLTDLFENIYLRTAGPDMYDKLTKHEIPWTDPSVKTALKDMAQIVGDSSNIAGGTAGALQTDFPTSVTQVFTDPPKAAMVIEADFVAGTILSSTKAKPGTGFDVFPFPSIDNSPPSTEIAGNIAVMLKDSPAARAFMTYLATPEAAEIWAKLGGFATLNKKVDPSVYPDAITRKTATALAQSQVSRFDLSDSQPASFGATTGQGLWKLFQDFLKNPTDIDGITQQMEDAAKKAYKS